MNMVSIPRVYSKGVNQASHNRGHTFLTATGDNMVNMNCWHNYYCPGSIKKVKRLEEEAGHTPRLLCSRECSSQKPFYFKTDCFFCGTKINVEDLEKV